MLFPHVRMQWQQPGGTSRQGHKAAVAGFVQQAQYKALQEGSQREEAQRGNQQAKIEQGGGAMWCGSRQS